MPLDALDYLAHPDKHPVRPVCVLYGDDAFLKRRSLLELRAQVLGADEGEFALTIFQGKDAELRAVRDELSTGALFGGGQRLVVVDEADEFVSRYRPELEAYVAKPKASGVLVLQVGTWPSNTRLFKALADQGLQIECKCPAPAKLLKWLVGWAKKQHQATLDPAAAEALVEIVEPELGLLDQELAKLAVLAGPGVTITPQMVHDAVGGWRTKTTWDMLDMAADGRAIEALEQLDHLLLGGEVPISLLGQISASLRKYAAATQLVEQAEAAGRRINLRQALEQAGIKPFVLGKAEGQLRQLGRVRGGQLYHWLLDADLALKGSSSSPHRARLVMEQLIVKMGRQSAKT